MSYDRLEAAFNRIHDLKHASAILQWDEAVMMPAASGDGRAQALATLGVVIHEHLTAPALQQALATAESTSSALDERQRANLREIQRILRRAHAVPSKLVEASMRAQLRCEQAWRIKRAENDWSGFAPLLEEVVARKREVAAALADALGVSPYDALLDEYEPFAKSAEIDRIFLALKGFLPSIIDAAIERQQAKPPVALQGPFPESAQYALGRTLMQAAGFDMRHGRLDVSHHPFCGGVPNDVRITTRYDAADFTSAMLGVLHETGHAKYEQGRPEQLRHQPVGDARGMSLHESQSLLLEMQISRGRPFLTFAAPLIRAAFPEAAASAPDAFTADNFVRLFTRVARTKIRVGADECTYPCHILLRYDLERKLVGGSLPVRDLPDAWDAGMREGLGISTGNDHRDGCLQDPHWASGAFGYFPTYTLGAMIAAQLFAAAVRSAPSIPSDLERGDFSSVDAFLREHVFSHASIHTTDELLRRATGEALNAKHFEAHLRRRYLDV